MDIDTYAIPVTTTGTAGAATGSTTSELIRGAILDIFLDFHASAPATSDTTIAFATRGGNVLAVANSATDALFAPRIKPVDSANVAITNAHDYFYINGSLTVSVAQSDALAPAVTAYVRVLR